MSAPSPNARGSTYHVPAVGVRSGDTPAHDRQRLNREPPDILITTPESLYLMLTSRARETLQHVETVIVDEIHSVVATKRGAHLFVSLERLEHLRRQAGHDGHATTDWALGNATAAWKRLPDCLGGAEWSTTPSRTSQLQPRPVQIVAGG